ncbi:ParB/RepB/Spo0J family partition protein [Candidatus Margulisiibacteriota bacterium]
MSNNKPRLGRGLEALIPKTFMTSGKTILNIAVSEIKPNPFQPRTHFDEESIRKLAESIKRYGLAQPVLVRRRNGYYELIAGERRYRACLEANIEYIPALIKETSDVDSLKLALIENLEREDLNPVEIARGYERLIQEFGMTHQLVAEIFGKSRSSVSNSLRLLRLPAKIQEAISSGAISEGHARTLLALDDEVEMLLKLDNIIQQGMNVREIEKEVQVAANKPERKKIKNDDLQLSLFKEMEDTLVQKYNASFRIRGSKARGEIVIKYSSEMELATLYNKLTLY